MPYSASEMFVTHGIPSFYGLHRKCIYNFSECISSCRNSIINANNIDFLIHKALVHGGHQYYINSSQYYLIPMNCITYYIIFFSFEI